MESGKLRSAVPGNPSGLGIRCAADHDLHRNPDGDDGASASVEHGAGKHGSYLGTLQYVVELAGHRDVDEHDERLDPKLGRVPGDVVFVSKTGSDVVHEVAVGWYADARRRRGECRGRRRGYIVAERISWHGAR